jgi:hypothetical protein
MILSGLRVHCSISGVHEVATRAGWSRPDRDQPNFSVAFSTKQVYHSGVGVAACDKWERSEKSTDPIHQENILSLLLRLSDSQAQPSKGTQGNNGSNSPLAGGIKSRAVRSHLSLALGEFVRCNSRSPRRGNGQVRPKIERTRRSEARGSKLRTRIDAKPSGSQVSCASLSHSPPANRKNKKFPLNPKCNRQ